MEDEPHEVVTLLLKRMESHPEEFRVADAPFHDRWYDHVNSINAYGNEADKAALATGLREIRLAETHERVMDELLNGDERRRKEEEEVEYERQMVMQGRLAQQQLAAHQNAVGRYQNAIGQRGAHSQAQAVGLAGAVPMSTLGTLTTQPTLSSSAINQIKQALGIKTKRGE